MLHEYLGKTTLNPKREPTVIPTIITCTPDSDDLALREVRTAVTEAPLRGEIAPGVLFIDADFESLTAAWRAAPPIFVRHMSPVQVNIPMPTDWRALGSLTQAARPLLDRLENDVPFSIQSRLYADNRSLKPFDINEAISGMVDNAPLDVRSPTQVISVVIGYLGKAEQRTLMLFMGISKVRDNLSDWAGGSRRFARDDRQVSRSEFKLLEAIEVFKIDLSIRRHALDLGAAPGGWTRILRKAGLYVTAVDPADLAPEVATDRGVRYKRMPTEVYLRRDPDQFDIIVNDMRMDGRDSARLMVDAARILERDGIAVMTVKLPESGRPSVLDHTFRILEEAYRIAGARQLFHNRSEITVFLKRR